MSIAHVYLEPFAYFCDASAWATVYSEENSNNNDEINAYITPVNLDGAAIRCTNMANLKRKEIILEFLDVLCYPGAVIKHIDLSINVSLKTL